MIPTVRRKCYPWRLRELLGRVRVIAQSLDIQFRELRLVLVQYRHAGVEKNNPPEHTRCRSNVSHPLDRLPPDAPPLTAPDRRPTNRQRYVAASTRHTWTARAKRTQKTSYLAMPWLPAMMQHFGSLSRAPPHHCAKIASTPKEARSRCKNASDVPSAKRLVLPLWITKYDRRSLWWGVCAVQICRLAWRC